MAPISIQLAAVFGILSTAVSAVPTKYFSLPNIAQLLTPANRQHLQQEMPTLAGLPSNQDATLKYAAVGVGNQNYTCNGSTYVQTDAGDGALAYLYDATAYFGWDSKAIQTLPAQRLKQFTSTNGNQAFTNTNPTLPPLGKHFFNSALQPNFNLYDAHPPLYLLAAKVNAVSAPDPSNIAWLYLDDAGLGLTNGLKGVYRVQTAGGQPPSSCSSAGEQLHVPYAAEYWFFD